MSVSNSVHRRSSVSIAAVLGCAAAIALLLLAGCSSSAINLRSRPRNPLSEQLQLSSWGGPKPSPRTMQTLRVLNLADDANGDARPLLKKLETFTEREPTPERVYAMAEVAYLGANELEGHDKREALDLYGAAVLHAHRYLFDEQLAKSRNAYDPQFRGACDLYNGGLESALRLVCEKKELVPGTTKTISTASGEWDITCVLRGSCWRPEDFGRFEFCSDYEIRGLRNHYQSHGLGVPLIAVRQGYKGEPPAARYYPIDLSFPVTAFMRPLSPAGPTEAGQPRRQGVLELYDPLNTMAIDMGRYRVPLQSDLSTPLAYFLSKPELNAVATVGLLNPEALMQLRPDRPDPIMGLYMVQPYQPGKIPVLLVHGLWSSPMTWMEMFNDLRSSPEIRDHYQFWFYLYPTAQPFWITAAQMRRDLENARKVLDPYLEEPALDQMVLVGHSMGGLVSRMQTIDSRDEFWKLASNVPLDQIKADPETRQELMETFYFRPNPSVRRVVTCGTPHRGSTFSNDTTQWLISKLVRLPQMLVASQQALFRENSGAFPGRTLLKIDTSVDSLAPDCPVFPVMLASHHLPWVKYHNIIGVVPGGTWLGRFARQSDGVVSQESARVEG
ncbi:MAG: esterase/lipase family protein, partial [Planctomycetota bacterium]